MLKNKFFWGFLGLFLVLLVCLGFLRQPQESYQYLEGQALGTTYHITLRSERQDEALPQKLALVLAAFSSRLSYFDAHSELSRINAAELGQWIDVSPLMSQLLRQSFYVHGISGGAFDPSLGPLIELWGFGRDKSRLGKIPSPALLAEMRGKCGLESLLFNQDCTQIQKTKAGFTLNFGAIAKGYAVDVLAQFLRQEAYQDFIVEIGGEVYASGYKAAPSLPWQVQVEAPPEAGQLPTLVLPLTQQGLATSGDYRQYFEWQGKRRAHTISAQTGCPVDNGILSVSVMHEQVSLADALATALMAMDAKDAEAFITEYKLCAWIYRCGEDGFVDLYVSREAQGL